MIKVVKNLNDRQILIERNSKHYLVSQSKAEFANKPIVETLVFPSDEEGNVLEWYEVGGERGSNITEYMLKLLSQQMEFSEWTAQD